MSDHDCKTPRTWLRRAGSLWVCECGQTWVLVDEYGFRGWRKWPLPDGGGAGVYSERRITVVPGGQTYFVDAQAGTFEAAEQERQKSRLCTCGHQLRTHLGGFATGHHCNSGAACACKGFTPAPPASTEAGDG